MSKRAAIILAAGKGKRMKSDLPKVLHKVHGKPIIRVLLDNLAPMKFDEIVVVIGHMGEMVRQELVDYTLQYAVQSEQLGTGHAVEMARHILGDFEGTTLVATGDVPYLSTASVEVLFETHERTRAVATCLSAVFEDPSGYGRIIRDGETDRLKDIVEHKDASVAVRAIREINSGIFCFDNQALFDIIRQIGCDNSQGEYYLTDAVKLLYGKGMTVSVVMVRNPDEVRGVNSAEQLAELEDRFPVEPRE